MLIELDIRCPIDTCQQVVKVSDILGHYMHPQKCGQQQCPQCQLPWTEGHECVQALTRKLEKATWDNLIGRYFGAEIAHQVRELNLNLPTLGEFGDVV